MVNERIGLCEAQEFFGYPAERIDVVPNGIPLVDFHPDLEARSLRRKIMQLRDDEIAVLFVGSGWERKGLRYATDAVESLGKKFRLFVAGRGRGRKVGGRAVQHLGAARDLPVLYAAADIFLLPTLYDPFSNACLEALATGLPVVTTRDNGFSEIIEQRVHGSILDAPSNIAQICEALLYWSDANRRESARPAILECAGHFDISVNVERTLAVLTHVLKADAVSGKIRKT
jgi:UDP-glucose:(heptosyl)LPS alpha-1,3-glucosyltransferase